MMKDFWRKAIRTIAIIIASLFILLVIYLAYSQTVPDRQAGSAERRAKAALPIGASRGVVVAWLSRNHWGHDGYEVCQTSAWPTPLHPCQGLGLIPAYVKGGPDLYPPFYTGYTEIDFYFDSQGHLRHYGAYPVNVYL